MRIQLKKNSCLKDQTLAIDKDGNPKASDDFGNIPPPSQNALKGGKTPYFLKISKIREIIYISAGVCSVKSYRLWYNALYKAGYAEPLIGGGTSRLLALEELGSVDQFFWNNTFETPTQHKIPIGEAIGAVFFTSRLAIELLPKPNFSGRPAPSVGGLLSRCQNPTTNFLKPRKQN